MANFVVSELMTLLIISPVPQPGMVYTGTWLDMVISSISGMVISPISGMVISSISGMVYTGTWYDIPVSGLFFIENFQIDIIQYN